MEDTEIEILSDCKDVMQITEVLKKFLDSSENIFTFPSLCQNNRRALFWTSLFQLLQNDEVADTHPLCLTAIRTLSRDKSDLENLICEKWIAILIDKAGLFNLTEPENETNITLNILNKDTVVEAVKCLCNITFNSEVARALCANSSISHGLIIRIKMYKDISFKEDIMLFDMKLMFILTALRPDIRNKIKKELHGMDYLINCVNDLVMEMMMQGEAGAGAVSVDKNHVFFNDNHQAICCEILKTQFNLILHSETSDSGDDDAMYLKLMSMVTLLLCAQASREDKLMELRSNIANLLTSVPPPYYIHLTPELSENETASYTYNGRDMESLQALIDLLYYRLTKTSSTTNQYENLSPILTVMNKSARSCRTHRKYLRESVLPHLKDVSEPPEKGNKLRNLLCKLLTTPVTAVRDLVAEFLFVLCKEKVSRLVKYTGFGNAAGHLAQKGLLGGGGSQVDYSSSSDSDTDEYIAAQPDIDPVVGCTRAKQENPFANMTEEQKEYEAMKLVNMFDQMMSQGVVKPARIGPDGRPEPIEHVMELRENPPNRPQS